jgi:hypothetical protein
MSQEADCPMKSPALAALALAFLSGPASAQSVTDKAVLLFRDACLATAPAFDKAMAAAKKYGVKPQMDLGASVVGMSPDGSFSLQVRGKKECAVTAESNPDPAIAAQFAAVVAQASGKAASSVASGTPVAITLHGQSYLVHHDRKGGEAYVLISGAGL